MDKLQLRMPVDDVERIIDTLRDVQEYMADREYARDLAAIEARLRYLLARREQRAAKTSAA